MLTKTQTTGKLTHPQIATHKTSTPNLPNRIIDLSSNLTTKWGTSTNQSSQRRSSQFPRQIYNQTSRTYSAYSLTAASHLSNTFSILTAVWVPGRRVLVVDDVDDSRTTLAFALQYLRPTRPLSADASSLGKFSRGGSGKLSRCSVRPKLSPTLSCHAHTIPHS